MRKKLILIYITIISLFPLIELDYLIDLNIPRVSTIIKFVVLPIIVALLFLTSSNKKQKLLFVIPYFLILGGYFILHHLNAARIFESLYLTPNFRYSLVQELIYIITLVLPMFYIFSDLKLEDIKLKFVVIVNSLLTAVPIFLGNIFTFGKSTYVGYTKENIFFWFTNNFNERTRHPRFYASKFFFKEGNTIGILMAMVLFLLYLILFKTKTRIQKTLLAMLIFIHSIAMIMLSTRIATYGALIIPGVILFAYVVLMILKKEQFKLYFLSVLAVILIVVKLILPYSPAIQNQKIDASDYGIMKKTLKYRDSISEGLKKGEKLIPGSPEYIAFYSFYFEDNVFLINITPPVYYTKYYDYKHDPKFWVDFIFNYELEERVNGRQLEKIFMDYKWKNTSQYTKLLGMGYSTFMNGSILLEKDFAQQKYTLGYIGTVITMFGWIAMFGYLGLKTLFNYRKWTLNNVVILMAGGFCLASAYVSGHTLDQFNTSLFLALIMGYMYNHEFKQQN